MISRYSNFFISFSKLLLLDSDYHFNNFFDFIVEMIFLSDIANNSKKFNFPEDNSFTNSDLPSKEVFNQVENAFNLTAKDRIDIGSLKEKELSDFCRITSLLLKNKIYGWHYYSINGKIEKHFVDCEIADRRLYNAKRLDNGTMFDNRY